MLSIPVIAMASISFFAGFYHLLIYMRSRHFRAHLTFSILCFAIVAYDAFCIGLYNVTSVAEGAQWQRLQFMALAIFAPAFLWFVSDYTNQKPGRAVYGFSLYYVFAFFFQLFDRSDLTFIVDRPSIKHIVFDGFDITYYEATLGLFTSLQSVVGLFIIAYILFIGFRYYKKGHKREALPLIGAIGIMSVAAIHDTLVGSGVYQFIYVMEYAYMATVLMMTTSLSSIVVDAAVAKEELRKSEDWFRSLVETTSDWVWEVDPNGRYTYASPKVRDLLGYEPEEVLGHTPFDFMLPEDAKKVGKIFRTIIQARDVFERVENINIRKDGQTVVLETSGIPFFNEEGELQGYRGIDRDITARRLAEDALHQSQQMLRTVLDQFPGVVFWKDRQSVYLGCNQAFASASGLSNPKEIVGKTDLDLPWAKTEAATYRADDREVMESGQPRLGIVEPQHQADGRLAWFDTSKVPLMDEQGNVIGILGSSRDITEQVHAIHALQETEFFLNRSQQVGRIGSYKFDAQLGLWESSPSLDELFGIDESFPKNVDGWLNLVIPEDREMMRDHMLRHVLVERQRFEKEYRIIRPANGEMRWMFGLGELEFDDAGHPVRMIGTIQDITERKQIERERETLIEELEAKNAELERFAYTVSHDLKSPLVTIKGFLGFIEKDAATGNMERLKGDLRRISDAVERMRLLLGDLLELSRVGRFFRPSEVVSFEDLANEAIGLVDGAIQEYHVTVRLQPGLPAVYGDRQRLVEVLQNLLDNACKFMGDQPDPCIQIGQFGEEKGNPIFYVKDNGVGFAPEYREHIFGLFNKLDPKSEGSGVGLALVKRIIEVHSGRIWVDSEKGKGATFYFTLPRGLRKS